MDKRTETAVSRLSDLCSAFNGRVGLYALNLQDETEIAANADDLFPTASVIKLPVLTTLMQQVNDGEYTLGDPLMLRRADHTKGSGLLQYLTPGVTLTIRDWAFLMMRISDNTATNVLIDHVGLPAVADWLAAHEFDGVFLHNKLTLPAVREDQNHFGTATARGLTRLLTAVFRHEIITPQGCDEMLRMMDKVGEDRVGRYLPWPAWGTEVPAAEKLHLAGKTGSFVGTRAQTAVIWRGGRQAQRGVALTILTAGNPEPETWSVDAPGVLLIGRMARILHDWALADE